jgi:hypothetical protein
MHDYDMEWLPYEEENVQLLPGISDGARALWTMTTPLIHNNVVEWHLPYRVVRQFGGVHDIPCNFDTDKQLHKRREVDLSAFINYWFDGPNRVPQHLPLNVALDIWSGTTVSLAALSGDQENQRGNIMGQSLPLEL